MQGSETRGDVAGIRSVSRAAALLYRISEHGEAGVRLGDLVRETGLSKATAHRILQSLVSLDLVDQPGSEPVYFPGFGLLSLASGAARRGGYARTTAAQRADLARRTRDTVFLTMIDGTDSVCIGRDEGTFPIKALSLDVGARRPLGVGAGSLALLAAMEPAAREAILTANAARYAEYGLEAAALRGAAASAARQGWALDDGAVISGTVGLGMALPEGVAALSVAAIAPRLTGSRRDEVLGWLRDAVRPVPARI